MTYLWMQFPLPYSLEKIRPIAKLHICDLCAGVWIYGVLSFFMGLDLLEVLGFSYVPLISELVTGGMVSFVVHVFTLGWKEKFRNTLIIE